MQSVLNVALGQLVDIVHELYIRQTYLEETISELIEAINSMKRNGISGEVDLDPEITEKLSLLMDERKAYHESLKDLAVNNETDVGDTSNNPSTADEH